MIFEQFFCPSLTNQASPPANSRFFVRIRSQVRILRYPRRARHFHGGTQDDHGPRADRGRPPPCADGGTQRRVRDGEQPPAALG